MPVTNQDLEALFKQAPTIAVPCSLGPSWKGTSYRLSLSQRLELDPYPVRPSLRSKKAKMVSQQFMGLHKCLFFTLQHPPVLSSLVRLAATVHEVKPWGPVTWLGRVSAGPVEGSHGPSLIWHRSLWTPPAPYKDKRVRFRCLVHPVRLSYNWKIVVIDLPMFPREIFDAFLAGDVPLESQP